MEQEELSKKQPKLPLIKVNMISSQLTSSEYTDITPKLMIECIKLNSNSVQASKSFAFMSPSIFKKMGHLHKSVGYSDDKFIRNTRKIKNEQHHNLIITSQHSAVIEHIKFLNKDKTQNDLEFIQSRLSNHFVFYNISSEMISKIVEKFEYCEAEEGQYIFMQGDLATCYFIIQEGNIEIIIDNKPVRELNQGDTFGELALLYNAPRSGSALCKTKTKMWAVQRQIFKNVVQSIIIQEYSFNRSFIDNIPFFGNMTSQQKDVIASELIQQKFSKDQLIVLEGDSANSFYIIKQGSVRIEKNNVFIKKLSVGNSFGETALFTLTIRQMSVIADEDCVLLALSCHAIKTILGDSLQKIVFNNIQRWAFEKSQLLRKLTQIQIQKIIDKTTILLKPKDDIIFHNQQKKGQKIIVLIEGNLIDEQTKIIQVSKGSCYGEEDIHSQNQNDIFERNWIMDEEGLIAEISRDEFEDIIGGQLNEVFTQNLNSFEKKMSIRKEYCQSIKQTLDIPLEKFLLIKKIGEGQFGCVYLVTHNKSDFYALKSISRGKITEFNTLQHLKSEKQVLEVLNFPFIVNYIRSYKDNNNIYFLTEYIKGLELFDVIREIGLLPVTDSQFYTGLLLLIVDYLHGQGIIYRDIKPENIMVDHTGYIKLIDMGTAKFLQNDIGNRTFTMIGTPHYMAPEIISNKGYSFPADLWSIGVCLYEFTVGMVPFGEDSEDPYEVYQLILDQKVTFPTYADDEDSKSLIQQLLNKSPEARAGSSYASLKTHPFFMNFDWDKLMDKEITPPYIPKEYELISQEEIDELIEQNIPVLEEIEVILLLLHILHNILKKENKRYKVRIFKQPILSDINWDKDF